MRGPYRRTVARDHPEYRSLRFRISNYLVELYGGDPAPIETYRAQIILFAWGKKKPRACLRFYEQGPLPTERCDDEGLLVLGMPIAMLPNVVDLLRNENPVFLEWKKDQDRPRLTTYLEPVGDGD